MLGNNQVTFSAFKSGGGGFQERKKRKLHIGRVSLL